MKPRPKYRATKKLLEAIAKGEFSLSQVTRTSYVSPHYDCLIDINKDWTLKLIIDEEAVKNNPDYFEEVASD